MSKGQIFTLDLFVSLIVVVLVISFVTVIVDNWVTEMYDRIEFTKMQSLAMDLASYEYHNRNLPDVDIGPYVIGPIKSSYKGSDCVVSIRGTGDNQVKVYVCK